MTDNNWITSKTLQKIKMKFVDEYANTLNEMEFDAFLSAEINKEIKNILEAAEKRDCETCEIEYRCHQTVRIRCRGSEDIACKHILYCSLYTKKG